MKVRWAGSWCQIRKDENWTVVCGNLKVWVEGSQKQDIWEEITTAVSSVGAVKPSPADVEIFNLNIRDTVFKAEALGYISHVIIL